VNKEMLPFSDKTRGFVSQIVSQVVSQLSAKKIPGSGIPTRGLLRQRSGVSPAPRAFFLL
jgi:hypothetical protein